MDGKRIWGTFENVEVIDEVQCKVVFEVMNRQFDLCVTNNKMISEKLYNLNKESSFLSNFRAIYISNTQI